MLFLGMFRGWFLSGISKKQAGSNSWVTLPSYLALGPLSHKIDHDALIPIEWIEMDIEGEDLASAEGEDMPKQLVYWDKQYNMMNTRSNDQSTPQVKR